jgi:sulfhydrogenase subunit beta (sulfur reductase)
VRRDMPDAIDRAGLDELFGALERRGYTLVGPTVRDRAIMLEALDSTADLPAGWTDVQEGGTYRIARRDDDALFGHNAGPNSWKSFLFPSELRVWTARQAADGSLDVVEDDTPPPRYAFIGARSCDLHAIAVQDRVFMEGGYVDQDYRARREGAFIVAVNCGQAAATCFCVSMDTGPKASSGFDLALTEVLEDGGHSFVVEVGSERGGEVLAELAHREARAARRCWPSWSTARRSPPSWRPRGARSRTPRRCRPARSTPTGSRSCSTATARARAGTTSPTAA